MGGPDRRGLVCGAHREHVVHICDAGRVKVKRLVERRALPRAESARRKHHTMSACGVACRIAASKGRGTGRAHVEHVSHGCHARRVKAQWLVELSVLPSRERRCVCGRGADGRRGPAAARAACRGEVERPEYRTTGGWGRETTVRLGERFNLCGREAENVRRTCSSCP